MADSTEELRFRAVGEDVSAGRMLDKLARGADKAGTEVKDLNKDLARLDDQMGATEVKIKGLLREFAETGDKSLFRDIRKDRSQLNMLKSIRKELAGEGREAGKAVSTGIADALGALPSQLKGAGIAIGVVLAVAMAPAVGAAVGAAVLGGVGAGGIAGGIAAAAQDPRVKAAGERLGDSLSRSFGVIGRPFVEPLIEQMGRLESIGASFFAELGDDIAPLADNLDNLVDGIEGFADNLDFSAAVKAAQPLINVLAEALPDIGDAITQMFEEMADGSDGTVLALEDLLSATADLIVEFGAFIGLLSDLYEGVNDFADAVGDAADRFQEWGGYFLFPGLIPLVEGLQSASETANGMTGAIRMAVHESKGFADGIGGIGESAEDAARELLDFSNAIDDAFGKQMSLDEATARYKRGIRELTAELKEGKRTLDENTEAGQDNADNVRDWLQNIEDLRTATIAQGGDVRTANATYEAQVKALKDVLLQLGYNKKAVDDLVGAYDKIPTRIEIELILRASTLPSKQALEHAMEGRASGGPVKAGRTYVVGEDGPEIVTFGVDGMVHTAAQSAAMMSGASGGSSGGGVSEVRASLEITGAEDEFVRMIRKIVKVRGGGIVQTAFGT